MSHATIRRALTAPAVLLTILTGACSDGADPVAPSRVAPPPRALASYASSGGAGVITLWDDDGRSYTLDAPHARVYVGATAVDLTPTQVAQVATAFSAAYAADQNAQALLGSQQDANAPSARCEVDPSGCGSGSNWDMAVGPGFDVPGTDVGPTVSPNPFRVEIRRGPPDPTTAVFAPLPASTPGGASGTQQFTPACLDIANAIYDETQRYHERRAALLRLLSNAAVLKVQVDGGGVSASVDLARLLGTLEYATAETQQGSVQLNVLATFYGAYNCWSNAWGGAAGSKDVPFVGAFASGGKVLVKVCHTETYTAYLSDGTTRSANVEQCDYMMN